MLFESSPSGAHHSFSGSVLILALVTVHLAIVAISAWSNGMPMR